MLNTKLVLITPDKELSTGSLVYGTEVSGAERGHGVPTTLTRRDASLIVLILRFSFRLGVPLPLLLGVLSLFRVYTPDMEHLSTMAVDMGF